MEEAKEIVEAVVMDPATEHIVEMPPYKELNEIKYSHLSRAEREADIQPVRTAPKIGRNELCPCGSGKKYKKCCLK